MIKLNKLNGQEITINCELIETITENPDTTIRLTTGNLYIVSQTLDEVVEASVQFKQSLFYNMLRREEA